MDKWKTCKSFESASVKTWPRLLTIFIAELDRVLWRESSQLANNKFFFCVSFLDNMTATCECNPSFNCESKNEQIFKSFCQNYIDQGNILHKRITLHIKVSIITDVTLDFDV